MNGFLIFLCVIAGIILFLTLVISIPVLVQFTYSDKIYLTVKYLFVKINILPAGEKKPKKEKTPKEEKKPEVKAEEPAEEKEKKPNPLLEMVKANGYDGMMDVLSNLGKVFRIYGGKLFRSVVFDEIHLDITVGTGDSAKTAIKYGQACQKVYPLFGFICSNNVVRKYDINVEPDFLANKSQGYMYLDFHVVVRKTLNATLAMVVRLLFKVVLKFLKGAKSNKSSVSTDTVANSSN